MDFLFEIIKVKRQRVEAAKAKLPIERLRGVTQSRSRPHRLRAALLDTSRPNIIAEFKRRSPSKGQINPKADPIRMAQIYEAAGAAAISVLTEEDHFAGSLEDLAEIRDAASLPVLRKDFIVDEYQVYESAAAGADALLLIVAALDDETLTRLRTITEDELGMDALVEVHSEEEMARAKATGARIIGVNNRDLRTFAVSTDTSVALAHLAPPDAILVSESGLDPAEVRELRKVGYRGFLVGEALMRADDPAQTIRDFIGEPATQSVFTKICGITNLEDARVAIAAGADMLGFNFYPRSPRFVEPAIASEIIGAVRSEPQSQSVKMIGVFVNETLENVLTTADEVGLDGIQLHGDETATFCRQIKTKAPDLFVMKALRPNGPIDLTSVTEYSVDALMLDAYDPNVHGGTGRLANWDFAREAARRLPRLFLAGGLSPENVAQAIAAVRPYAVDACSALETTPGKKDHVRVRRFVAAVRASKLPAETTTP